MNTFVCFAPLKGAYFPLRLFMVGGRHIIYYLTIMCAVTPKVVAEVADKPVGLKPRIGRMVCDLCFIPIETYYKVPTLVSFLFMCSLCHAYLKRFFRAGNA